MRGAAFFRPVGSVRRGKAGRKNANREKRHRKKCGCHVRDKAGSHWHRS
ncbi:hypothetical protein GL4_0041 [Methyloceanibacter caenitepidi]|uniref:Uncharacterized protein n=1 Tax=Methyloceanibacter caenitepidi TaxID=1384459 RepID=A0A0A8JYU6_9HYPH|nr:hypothetical protein GL4_0041 [Methyloceanibacter caenitepidi]